MASRSKLLPLYSSEPWFAMFGTSLRPYSSSRSRESRSITDHIGALLLAGIETLDALPDPDFPDTAMTSVAPMRIPASKKGVTK